MNLVLFDSHEITRPLPRDDPRARHLLEVLHRREGDTFDAGLIDGPRGKGAIVGIGKDALTLRFDWTGEPPSLPPVVLIVGLPRPQTARDILRDATTLGVSALHFVLTEKGDPNYAQSTLWNGGELRRHLVAGAGQAFTTRLPAVTHGLALADAIAGLPAAGTRIALDNYESPTPLSRLEGVTSCVALAVGPERGWSAPERDLLRANGFTLVHLGERVLRTETAVVAALTLVQARLGGS